MGKILAAFIAIPLVELVLLIAIGQHIGIASTVALIVATGILGATLARSQGLRVLRQIKAEAAAGRLPAASLVDGVIILLAGAVLLTPGVLTDLVGFLCLIPGFRRFLIAMIWRKVMQLVQRRPFQVAVNRY